MQLCPLFEWSVPVPVMDVRVVWVRMGHGVVNVSVGMGLTRRVVRGVAMPMVLVVPMPVTVG